MVTRYTNLRSPFVVEVTLHVLLLFLLLVFHRYMCDAVRRDFASSASFVLECLDGSEVTTREGNELVVQKENCVVEEIKEVELRSRRGKFIYKGTYNSVGLNKVSHFSRRHRAPSRPPIKKLESLLQKTRKVRLFLYGRAFGKIHYCRLKFIVTLKIEKGLHLNRYRSNCNSVRFLRKGQLQN